MKLYMNLAEEPPHILRAVASMLTELAGQKSPAVVANEPAPSTAAVSLSSTAPEEPTATLTEPTAPVTPAPNLAPEAPPVAAPPVAAPPVAAPPVAAPPVAAPPVAAPPVAAPPVPPAPPAASDGQPAGPARDSAGLPWDYRIHSASRALVADGTWRRKRGVEEALVGEVEAELRAALAAPAAPTPAQAFSLPPPPVLTFPKVMFRITSEKIGPERYLPALASVGLATLPMLATRPDLSGAVWAALDASAPQ